MRSSLLTSTIAHVLLIGFAVSSFTAPRTLDVADVEAFPIDIVPIEEITQIQQGDKKAPIAEKPAPTPTQRPDVVEDAEAVGENTADLSPDEAAKPSEREVAANAPPKPAEKPSVEPAVIPDPAPETVKAAEPEPKPEPEPVEAAKPLPEPEPEPEPEPIEMAALPPEPAPAQEPSAEPIATPAEPEFAALPSAGPVPEKRPTPAPPKPKETAQAKPAETAPERREEKTASASSRESDFNADEIAALLNKDQTQGGGAKRSTETASLGGSRTTRGETLSQSEMDALRGQIQRHWNIIPGMADGQDVRITVKMRLDQSGNIIGNPDVSATGGEAGTRRTLAGSAQRAVLKAQPYQLPASKYDSWSEVVVNFDPSQMF